MNSYVEFEYADPERFEMLCRVFDALRTAKETGDFRDDDYWLAFFDERSRAHFWWPTPEEAEEWLRRWKATPWDQRHDDTAWDFGSMIEAFQNGDYSLEACEQTAPGRARLEFRTLGWPYGGTGCMHALIEAFDGRVTGEVE